jgi:integrase
LPHALPSQEPPAACHLTPAPPSTLLPISVEDLEARLAGELDGSRPYDLRHAFCSLLIAEGLSVVEIAQQAGHSPAMMLATYAHVIEELAGTERRPAEAVIRDARDKLVSEMCPPARRQRRH